MLLDLYTRSHYIAPECPNDTSDMNRIWTKVRRPPEVDCLFELLFLKCLLSMFVERKTGAQILSLRNGWQMPLNTVIGTLKERRLSKAGGIYS